MTLMIQSWCAGDPCDPCKPKEPPPSGGFGLPPFTDAAITIYQYQMYVSYPSGQISMLLIGQSLIYSAIDNIPPKIHWGTPSPLGPIEYGFSSTWVGYGEWIQILHPYYAAGSYNPLLLNTTGVAIDPIYGFVTGPGPYPADQTVTTPWATPTNAITSTGGSPNWIDGANQAIALAYQVLGNPT